MKSYKAYDIMTTMLSLVHRLKSGEAPARGAGKGSRDAQAPKARGRGSGQRGWRGRRVALKHSIILQAYIYAGAAVN